MKTFKTIVLFILLGALILFIIQNMELVRLRFLTIKVQMPLSLFSVIVYILGALSGGILYSMVRRLLKNNH